MEMTFREKARSMWHIQRAKGIIRERLGGAQCMVSVRETICTDLGCEGPVTEIRIVKLTFQEIKATIHKSASQITPADVAAII